jgi:hypothetical protein
VGKPCNLRGITRSVSKSGVHPHHQLLPLHWTRCPNELTSGGERYPPGRGSRGIDALGVRPSPPCEVGLTASPAQSNNGEVDDGRITFELALRSGKHCRKLLVFAWFYFLLPRSRVESKRIFDSHRRPGRVPSPAGQAESRRLNQISSIV